jgi:hypothetical protein
VTASPPIPLTTDLAERHTHFAPSASACIVSPLKVVNSAGGCDISAKVATCQKSHDGICQRLRIKKLLLLYHDVRSVHFVSLHIDSLPLVSLSLCIVTQTLNNAASGMLTSRRTRQSNYAGSKSDVAGGYQKEVCYPPVSADYFLHTPLSIRTMILRLSDMNKSRKLTRILSGTRRIVKEDTRLIQPKPPMLGGELHTKS